MNHDFQRFLAFVGATICLVLVGGVLGKRLLFEAAGPDGAIITHLKELERDGLSIATDAGTLLGSTLQYQRISVTLDAAGTRATVTSTLDFTGQLRRADADFTRVSSLGLERATYVLDGTEWTPETNDAPRLVAIVKALDARRVAQLRLCEAAALAEHREPRAKAGEHFAFHRLRSGRDRAREEWSGHRHFLTLLEDTGDFRGSGTALDGVYDNRVF